MKLKSLKPSMKENKRYLVVSGVGISRGDIERAILEFLGVNGMSQCGLSFIKSSRDEVIICINREMVDSVRAAICVYFKRMEVLRVSGTLKGLGMKKNLN